MKPAASIVQWFTAAAAPAIRPPRHSGKLIHILFGFGIFSVFLVSVADSSIVPLPIPGITDIMLVVMGAHHQSPILLVLLATAGSAIGGYTCYQAGRSGGMAFIQKRTPPAIFTLVTEWVEDHAILAVAIPAILPPPVPLTPFVLAAGALKMSRKQFLTTFTLSRALRHAIAVWLGIYYGRHILHLWSSFSTRWATTILTVLWTAVTLSVALALWKLYKTSRTLASRIPASRIPASRIPASDSIADDATREPAL